MDISPAMYEQSKSLWSANIIHVPRSEARARFLSNRVATEGTVISHLLRANLTATYDNSVIHDVWVMKMEFSVALLPKNHV